MLAETPRGRRDGRTGGRSENSAWCEAALVTTKPLSFYYFLPLWHPGTAVTSSKGINTFKAVVFFTENPPGQP